MDQIASGSLEFYRYIVRNLGTSIQIILSDLKAYVEGEEGPSVRNFTQNDVSLECGSCFTGINHSFLGAFPQTHDDEGGETLTLGK